MGTSPYGHIFSRGDNMKPAIEDLWNGSIVSAENCGVGDPEIENLVMLMERHKLQLDKELGQTQRNVFEKYADCAEEYAQLLCKCAFGEGFCLASRLMAEALYAPK